MVLCRFEQKLPKTLANNILSTYAKVSVFGANETSSKSRFGDIAACFIRQTAIFVYQFTKFV
jgi:hypothetical protein